MFNYGGSDFFKYSEASILTPNINEFTEVVGDVKEENAILSQSLDYSKFTPLLTAALQEAITKIETLETKVAALEAA